MKKVDFLLLSVKAILVGFILFIFMSFLLGCAFAPLAIEAGISAVGASAAASKVGEKGPPKSQMEIRELQTRMYEIQDTKMVMKTILNVLQDDGFIVKEANAELGFLTAAKEIDVETKEAVFWGTFLGGTWEKGAIVEATSNVSEFGKQTRIRINFQKKVYDSVGKVIKAQQIEDPKFYQEFFAKVDKGLFIQKEKL